MLRELRHLFAAVPLDASYSDYRRAAVEDNALEKATAANRLNTLWYVKQLYGLERDLPVFVALRELWAVGEESQAHLALLCALARDILFRTAAPSVLEAEIGERVTPADISAHIRAAFPDRYSAASLRNLGSNMASSWTQAGYLAGKQAKNRIRPEPRYPAVVYAAYLGHLEGHTGPALFTTYWARALDTDEPTLRHLAEVAARSGWLEFRSSGGMTAITFHHLDQITGWEPRQDG